MEDRSMRRATRLASLGVAAVLLPALAPAQFPSAIVGFNTNPDVETSHEMFQIPEFSGSTVNFVVPNSAGALDNNNAFRAAGRQTEGAAALQVFFRWVDPSDPQAWVRLSSFNGAERPNPALHTQGKVRFNLVNISGLFDGEIGVCIGIRETGNNVPQLNNGGSTGDIEWVGVTGVVTDPNGVVLAPIPAITLPPSPAAVTLEWDLATGIVSVNGTPMGGGIAGMTGDGILNAPNNRGTLEHIAFTNVSSDSGALIDVSIDELQFEAPEPDPVIPPTLIAPIIAADTQVSVTDLLLSVNRVNLLRDDVVILTQDVANNADVTFTLPAPAQTGEVYTFTQRDGITGLTSDPSNAVTVLPEASPYSLSFVIDEDGDGSCSFEPPGGWEFVGATSLTGLGDGTLFPAEHRCSTTTACGRPSMFRSTTRRWCRLGSAGTGRSIRRRPGCIRSTRSG